MRQASKRENPCQLQLLLLLLLGLSRPSLLLWLPFRVSNTEKPLILLWIKPYYKRVSPTMGRAGPFSVTVGNCWMHLRAHLKAICAALRVRPLALSRGSQVHAAANQLGCAGRRKAPPLKIKNDFFFFRSSPPDLKCVIITTLRFSCIFLIDLLEFFSCKNSNISECCFGIVDFFQRDGFCTIYGVYTIKLRSPVTCLLFPEPSVTEVWNCMWMLVVQS